MEQYLSDRNQLHIFDNDNFSIIPKSIFSDNDNLPISCKNADLSAVDNFFDNIAHPYHQCASKRSGSVGNRGELAPLNQARGAQSTKSCLGGTELCKAQNCSKHKIVQSTKRCKNQNCAKHKIVQRTKLCKAQICAKHKLVLSTK